MKRLIVILAAAALAGCASVPETDAQAALAYRNPFADYETGMRHTTRDPLGSYWQQEHRGEIDAATAPEVLARFTRDAAAADALLKKVDRAYRTDPATLTQIGAVSQLVMDAKNPDASRARKVWTAALERALSGAEDAYRKAFFADQLRWCGYRK